mgnify:CR=1 FL=1
MNKLRPIGLAVLTTMLAACAAPAPIRHYTLQPPAVAAGEDALSGFVLKDVRVPAHVDVVPLMIRRGDAALAVMEGHQWASPLKLEWRGALGLALRRAGAGPDLARSGLAPSLSHPGRFVACAMTLRCSSTPGRLRVLPAVLFVVAFTRSPDSRCRCTTVPVRRILALVCAQADPA